MADVAKGLVYHNCFAEGILQQFAAGLGHFWAAYTDKFDIIVTCFAQSSYQAGTVGIGTRLSGTNENAVYSGSVRHKCMS
jgi:hypothetical protein